MSDDRMPILAPEAVTAPDGALGTAVQALAVVIDLLDAAVTFDPAALAAAPEVLVSHRADGRVTIEVRRRRARAKAIVAPIPEPGGEAGSPPARG
jgi:hypothetical protein